MKRKLINKIILALTITLMTITSFTVGKYITLKEQKNAVPVVQVVKEETNLISKEILIKKLNDENKMLVLSGDTEVKMTYSNKEIADDDIAFKWVKDKLSEMSSKDLKVQATYTYNFHYDLKDLDITIVNNIPNIYLSRNRLSCDVNLVENKTIYVDRVGLFESQFTPNEVNSLNERTKALVLNKVQSERDLRDRAMENIQKNIEDLLGINCEFSVTQNDVVEYDNKSLKIIN